MATYTSEPLEWKSAKWYRNRPLEERVLFFRAPKRVVQASSREYSFGDWDKDTNIFIHSKEVDRNVAAHDFAMDAMESKWHLSARWVTADDYIQMVKDSFDNDGLGDDYESPWILHNIQKVHDVVVLANLGDERNTEFATHELHRLITDRWDNMKPMIITSRMTIAELGARYGSRVAEALATYEIEVP